MEYYADPLDRATVEQDRLLQEQIRQARKPGETPIPLAESCHNCGEPFDDPSRFCDADCRDDFEKRRKSQFYKR